MCKSKNNQPKTVKSDNQIDHSFAYWLSGNGDDAESCKNSETNNNYKIWK